MIKQISCVWSPAKYFGTKFSSNNAGDGPKRLHSQVDYVLGFHHSCGSEWHMPLESRPASGDLGAELRIACWNSNGHLVSND